MFSGVFRGGAVLREKAKVQKKKKGGGGLGPSRKALTDISNSKNVTAAGGKPKPLQSAKTQDEKLGDDFAIEEEYCGRHNHQQCVRDWIEFDVDLIDRPSNRPRWRPQIPPKHMEIKYIEDEDWIVRERYPGFYSPGFFSPIAPTSPCSPSAAEFKLKESPPQS